LGRFLGFFLINVFPVADPEHKDFIPHKRIDYPAVSHTIFSKAGKLPFEDRIGMCLLGELFLNLM